MEKKLIIWEERDGQKLLADDGTNGPAVWFEDCKANKALKEYFTLEEACGQIYGLSPEELSEGI